MDKPEEGVVQNGVRFERLVIAVALAVVAVFASIISILTWCKQGHWEPFDPSAFRPAAAIGFLLLLLVNAIQVLPYLGLQIFAYVCALFSLLTSRRVKPLFYACCAACLVVPATTCFFVYRILTRALK